MKNYNRYGLIPALAAAALALGSCNESIRTYDGQTGIYFAMLQSGSDEENPRYTADSSLPFALLPSGTDEQTLQLRVKVIGSVADYPRAFAFRTVADRTRRRRDTTTNCPRATASSRRARFTVTFRSGFSAGPRSTERS